MRFCERLGALFGLAASAFFLREIGADTSLHLLGLVVLLGVVFYVMVEAMVRASRS